MRLYRLAKSKKILFHFYHLFRRKKKNLSASAQEELIPVFRSLEKSVVAKEREKAAFLAQQLEMYATPLLRKTVFEQVRDFMGGIGFALLVAILIRQVWFELYEIPTGSMRPTFKEQDRLSVSKTDFGINIPLKTGHFYFDPALIQRNGIVIFTAENMDVRDPDTVYFYLFPGKKLFVKRLIGKPGDILYFYGGKIYGIDVDGKDITPELQLPELEKIDHIPFISFEGKVQTVPSSSRNDLFSPVILYQMNEPIARLWVNSKTEVKGELFPKLTAQNPSLHYRQIWGFENFGMARLLTKEQVKQYTDQDPSLMEEGLLYLEIRHSPSLVYARLGLDYFNRLRPLIGTFSSLIPLQEEQLKTLFSHLYTSRFVVAKGFAHPYGINSNHIGNKSLFPYLPAIPDGTYEFYEGKGYQVKWQGYTTELPTSHPLCRFDIQTLQTLFNTGMEFDTRYSPQAKEQYLFPHRYVYFRDKDLYVMGAPLLLQSSPLLNSFLEREESRRVQALSHKPYFPFVDKGAPLLESGEVDPTFIRQFGIKVPEKSYLVLGDNHANSGDSREFGFVPEENLKGGPVFIFWPPGSRFGRPNQPPYTLFNTARVVVWALAACGFGVWAYVHRRRHRFPLELD